MRNLFKIISVVVLFVLMSCEQTVQKSERRIKAVPINAVLVIEADEIGDAFENLHNNSLWSIISKDKSLSVIGSELKSLMSFLNKKKISIDDNKLLLSVHKTRSKSFDYLIYLDADDVEVDVIKGLKKYKGSTKTYDKAIIEKYSLPEVAMPVYVSSYKGIVIFSRNIILVENSIRQLNSNRSLMNSDNFKSLYNAINSKEDFNVLINLSKFDVVENWASQKDAVYWSKSFSDWIELDVSLEKDEVFLSGIASTNDSIGHFLGVFENQKARKITIDELLPSATSFSISYGIESFPKYYRSYTEYLRKHGKLGKFERTQKAFKIKKSDLFDSWIDDQMTIASITSNQARVNYNDLVLIKSNDEAIAIEALELVSDKSVIDFRSYGIRRFVKKGVLGSYLGGGFNKINLPYYTVIDDVVVFSDNLKIVKDVISDYLDGRSLSNYQHFKNLKSDLSSKSNILLYFKNPDFAETVVDVFPDLKRVISGNIKELSKYKSGAIQFSYDGGVVFTNVILKHSVEEENEVKPKWELDFDVELYSTINTLYNHKTKNKELAVQDKIFTFSFTLV